MSFFILILFGVSVFGFIFSAALLIRKKPLAYYFFIAVYLIFNLSLLVNLIFALNYEHALPHLYRMVSPLQFLLGPFSYFFYRTTLRPFQKFQKVDLLHLIPFIVCLIGLIPIYLLSVEEKLRLIALAKDSRVGWYLDDTFGLDYIVLLRVKFFTIFIYLFFQWKMVLKFNRHASKELKELNSSLQVWLLFDNSLKTLIGVSVFISSWLEESTGIATMLQLLLIVIELIGSAIFLIASPDLLKGVVFQEDLPGRGGLKPIFPTDIDDHGSAPERQGIQALTAEQDAIIVRIEQYLQLEQPFLNPDFTLSDLSQALGLPMRAVSTTIKSGFGVGFPEFINKRRISYLEKLLLNKPDMLQYSVDALAKSVGFSSRSGFYKAFKKIESYESPAQMIEQIKEELSSKK
jgi:AraC-like DNA-binding protein